MKRVFDKLALMYFAMIGVGVLGAALAGYNHDFSEALAWASSAGAWATAFLAQKTVDILRRALGGSS